MIDLGSYGWKFVAGEIVRCSYPGFVKKYRRRVRRIERKRETRKGRYSARAELHGMIHGEGDEDVQDGRA